MKGLLVKLVRSDDGQDLIEYGLLVGIITIGAIAAINADRSEGEDLLRQPQHGDAIGSMPWASTSKRRRERHR